MTFTLGHDSFFPGIPPLPTDGRFCSLAMNEFGGQVYFVRLGVADIVSSLRSPLLPLPPPVPAFLRWRLYIESSPLSFFSPQFSPPGLFTLARLFPRSSAGTYSPAQLAPPGVHFPPSSTLPPARLIPPDVRSSYCFALFSSCRVSFPPQFSLFFSLGPHHLSSFRLLVSPFLFFPCCEILDVFLVRVSAAFRPDKVWRLFPSAVSVMPDFVIFFFFFFFFFLFSSAPRRDRPRCPFPSCLALAFSNIPSRPLCLWRCPTDKAFPHGLLQNLVPSFAFTMNSLSQFSGDAPRVSRPARPASWPPFSLPAGWPACHLSR